MRTILRKLFGASTGGGACLSFFVFALTGLISGIPLAARAQDSVTVGTVTFRDKDAASTSAVTVGRPDLTNATIDKGNWTSFTVTPANLYGLPEGTEGELPLSAISVMWLNDNGDTGDIAQAQHIVLVDASGNVVAVSEAPDVTPAQEDITSTYAFPADTTLDATATYTGYFVADAATVTVGEAWSGTPVEVRTRIFVDATDTTHDDCFVTDHTNLLPPIGFAFGAGDLDALEWTATPWFTADSSVDAGAYAKFGVCFRWMWQGARFPWPNDFVLRSVSVPFVTGYADGNNASVRRLVLTDSSNTVVALSEPLAEAPSSEATNPSVFTFTGVTLSPAETYSGYFVGDVYPALGQTYTASPLGQVRYQTRSQPSNAGCFVGTVTNHAPNFSFEVAASEVEQSLGALNINFDTDANRLVDDTLYGLTGVQYLGSQWNDITTCADEYGENAPFEAQDTAGNTVTVTYAARLLGNNNVSNADPLLRQVLTDGDPTVNPWIELDGIPYETYDVYIYMSQHDGGYLNGSVTLNEDESIYYYMEEGQEVASTATTNTSWGANNNTEPNLVFGKNVIRIPEISGSTLRIRGNRGGSNRSNIAAVQIVELRTEPEPTHWEGAINADVAASALQVSNGITQKALSALTAADTVELSFEGTATLTVDAAVTVDTLTLTGAEGATLAMASTETITAAEITIEGGLIMTAEDTFVSEAPIDLAEGTTFAIMATPGTAITFNQALTGAGHVEILPGTDVTVTAPFSHTGGVTLSGTEGQVTTLRYAGVSLGSGAITVGPECVFDLNGHACAQAITLNGGTLRADEAITDTVGVAGAAAVNFNSGRGSVGTDEVGGLLPMRGSYWTNTTGGTGTSAFSFYDSHAVEAAGASVVAEGSVTWSCAEPWNDSTNQTSYLKGYLDDTGNHSLTLTIPESIAAVGYSLYLYSSVDATGGSPFSARRLTGDNGTTTSYTYANGALTTGSTAGWGNPANGRSTVAEGTNVMVIPGLTDRSLTVNFPNESGRGGVAALQILSNASNPGNVAGSLSVTGAGSTIEIADGLDISFVGSITVSGEGTLSKVGTGTMTLLGAAVTGDFAITEGVAALNEASVSGTITVNNENGLTLDAASYEGLTVSLPEAASAQATAESVTIGALTGEGSFDFKGATSLTLANAGADFTGSFLNATDATLVVAGGTFAPTEAQIDQVDTLRAEGGTLSLPNANAPRLEVAGGTVAGPGGGSLAAYTEISAGSVALDTAGTAASARPAAETAGAATVENFTLAEGGTIHYDTPADRDLYFPEGFIPFRGADAQPYVIVLGEDFADFATFPFSFTVLGADTDASFTLQRPDGNAAPESSYTVDGSAITVWNVGAIIDYSEDLPQARYHYAFDGNLNSTGSEATALTNENAVYVTSENGRALSAGSPYATDISFSGAWTLGLYLNVAEAAPHVTLFHAAVQAGFTSPGALFLTTGETADEIVLWRRNNGNTDYDALVTADLGLGGANAWHHVLVTHTDTRIRLYVDGEQVGEVDGTFENTYTDIQIGKGLGGDSLPDHTNGAGTFQLDDLIIWPAALRDVQIEKALATTTAAWRIREGETPAELFTADAPWTRTDGTADVFAATGEDASTLTARATLSVKAGAEELFTALQSFTARYVLLEGEPLTYALTTLTAPTLPANIQTLVVDNDLTVDLSAVNLAMASQIAAEPSGHLLLPGLWRGTVTLTNVPEGFDFTVEVRDTGLYLSLGSGDYPWSLSFDTFWDNLSASTLYGMDGYQVAGSNWNTVRDTSYTVTNPRRQDGTTQTGVSLSVVNAGGQWYHPGYGDLMMKGTTDGPSRYAFTGLPAGQYEVVVYFHTRGANNVPISPVKVIGGGSALWYTYAADASEPTASDTVPTTGWGDMSYDVVTHGYSEALGKTILRAPATVGMDGTLTIEVSDTEDPTAGPGLDWQLPSGVTARGFIAGVQVVAIAPMPLYTRTVSGTAAWTATGAWTNVNDGTTVDVPPEGARLMVEATDAAILTVSGALPAYDSLTVVGGGSLALSVDGQNLLTDDEYRAIPQGQSHTVTVLDAAIDPAQVSAWVFALKYGATATVSATEAGITVSVRLPDVAYPETQPDESESISFNFWDFTRNANAGRLTATDIGAANTDYATLGAYWAQPAASVSGQGITQTVDAIVVANADRANAGAATRTLTGAITFGLYHTYRLGIGRDNQPILAGYANGHSLSGGQGSGGIPYATVNVPEDWDTYTAVIYMSTDSGSPQWLPKRVNGTFYYYEGTTLTTLADTPQATTVGALPDEVKDTTHAWGAPTQDGSLVEGTNMMVIPGLTGDFKLEWWSKPAASGNNVDVTQTQGRVAAFQLIENSPDVLPDLDTVQVYQAELTGEANWADLQWTINGEAAENVPGAADLVELTLTNDATLTFDAATTVSSITVYGQGHALRVTDAANATATWHFLNDTILALGADTDILPATIGTNPKRVRYDYTYAQDYASTQSYETEFAAGFNASLNLSNGGLIEFSAGDVTVGTINPSNGPTVSTLIFSGDASLTMTGTGNANGLKIANGSVTFRDNARATLSRIHMRCLNASDGTLIVEDNAAITVTGAVNEVSNYNTLQLADWPGTGNLVFRDNARFTAAGADMVLCNDGADRVSTVTVQDNAEVRVKGVARRSQSIGVINLNGGRFLIGSDGFRTYSANYSGATLEMHFNGGALGAWQDWTWDAAVADIVPTVTGDPILETSRGVTLTLAADANLFSTALEATVRGEGTVASALSTLPTLTLEGGTFETTVAAQAPSVSLKGGTLALSDVLTVVDGFESHGAGAVRIPVSPSGADGWLAMAEGGLVPNVANVVFTLALDLAGAESLLPYRVPLFMGAYRNNVDPTCGFAYSGNVNNAVSTATPVYVKGNQGQGLYAQLAGNAVVQPHTQTLNDTPYTLDQSTASVYDYWIFNAETAGGKLTITDGGIGIKDVSFEGLSAVIIASGTEPHTLLQTETLGLGIPVTFDLTAWDTALDAWAAGAVNGVPASLCLASGQVSVETTPTFIGWEAPAGVIVSIEQGERGLYLVATSNRLASTVSVNFSDRANPLSATPAAPGAYAVPVAAWNDLQGLFSSAQLYVSDIGGAATVQAIRGAGEAAQPTQVSSSATATASATANPSLLQVWLSDSTATTLRVANAPFARYRLALIFSCDIEDAAFATVTVGTDTYAMDAAGYVRKNVTGLGKVAGDTQWGSTNLDTADYFRQGTNVLLTDVITDASVTVSLPAFVYGRTYAGIAAVQIIEAPDTATSEEGTDYTYAFTAGDENVNLANLDLTVDGVAGQTWQSGANNTLSLTVPEGLDVTLTLPLNFQADRISATGKGSLTLQVEENGGAALGTLDATGLGNLTVHFPCVGVAFEPASGVSRFEAAFNNNGATYTIAAGATLALGADSGVAVSLNGTLDRTGATTTLAVNLTSPGTLRRDYPMSIPSLPNGTNGAETDMTMAFKAGTAPDNPVNLRANLLVEDGDVLRVPNRYHFSGASLVYTQTGGLATFESADATQGGFLLLAAASPDNATAEVSLGGRNGARLETPVVWSWRGNAHVDLDVSGDATLAVGNMGLRAYNATAHLEATFSEDGTLELTDTTLGTGGSGTVATTFNGGRIASVQSEATLFLPVTFAGTADAPTTLDPGKYGTLVLNAANTAAETAVLAVPRGTLALADASGLGGATVTVADGAAFEARGFTGENEASGATRTVPVVAIKLDIPAGVGHSDGTAIQELCLYQDAEKVDWPLGTTISGTGGQNAASNEPNWAAGGNEAINALIDGVTGDAASPGTWTNPAGGSGTYTDPARRNKWYPIPDTTGTASAIITLGSGVVFDSYTLWNTDLQARFPTAWTLSVRYEGDAEDSWTVLHAPTGQTRPAANDESEKYAVELREGGATTLDAVTGKVVFASGAQCRAVRKVGVTGLPYVARIAGTIDLPDSGKDGIRFFLDGEEFAVANVTVNEGNGTVTFGAGGPIVLTDVVWDVTKSTGTWADGSTGPWVDGAIFRNGAGVTFPAANEKITVSVRDAPRPDAFSMEGDLDYTFSETEAGDRIDLGGVAAVTNVVGEITVRAIDLGEAVYDVPIDTGAANRGVSANGSTIRLAGALSADGKTATLVGSGNLNATGDSAHGAWFDGSENPVYLTLSPHAGETQTLSAYAAHLRGEGIVTIAGQVADDGSVSGGTVEFGGTSSTGGNNAFSGTFEIRDGATLDFTMTRTEGGDNPYFQASDGTPLYKNGLVGFTLRNGGVLRFSGHRGFIGGWGQIHNSTPDLWTSQPIVIGYRSALECVYGSGTHWQHTPYGLRFNGDGATLTIDDGSASGLGVDFVRGATLTVAGVGDAGDPADPKVDATPDSETTGLLTEGITATIQTVEGATMRIFGDNGQDDALFLDVGEGSTLRVAADLGSTTPDGTNRTDPAPFVKRGPGRMTLEWPEITNLVEVEVEEGTLGGTAALTDVASVITMTAGTTIEAGLSVSTLTVEPGVTLAIDPTGARQLRADTALFANGGAYLVDVLAGTDLPDDATGREPIKVISWANAPDAVNAAFQPSEALIAAGYGLEVRTDGLYLMPAITYYRELTGIAASTGSTYQLRWDAKEWYTSLDVVGQADQAVTFNPSEGVTVNVVLLLPEGGAGDQLPGILINLSGPTTFSSLRVARLAEVEGVQTLETVDSDIAYAYDLRNETPPAEGEVKVYEWLTSLVYLTNGDPEVARLQATVPEDTAYTVDGTSVVLYRVADGRAAINVSFAAGTEGSPSWLSAEIAPCGPVPYAGVYWNNITATTGTPLTTSGANHEVYQTPITVSGLVDDANNPETASLTYAYSTSNGFGSVNNRTLNGNARLASAFLRGANVALTPVGGLEAPGHNAGWTVRVSDIPFTHYDLYLLFAGSADGSVTYPAVRVKVGTEAWRTYSFVNGWTTPAGNAAAWAGQGYSAQGFVDGLNLLHLRIEGSDGGSVQIAPYDTANTTAVGLAGLQIVELDQDDPVYYRFVGTRWGDGSAWSRNGEANGAWSDASLEAPHYARFSNTATALEVDREVAVPFLRFDGVSNLTVTGEPGFLSTGGLDFTDVTSEGTVTFEEDVFAQPPEVLLGSGLTLELPEPEAGTLDNDWRWRYIDAAANNATFHKTKAGGLRLTQSVGNNLRIDNGTLWLTSVSSNASTNYPYAVGGEGTLGWAGTGTLRIAFNNLPAGNTDPEGAFLRLSSGTVTLRSTGDLPADRAIVIDGGTVQFSKDGQRLFSNGRFLVRNGGTLHYNGRDASNLFQNNNASVIAQLPSVFLDGGRLQDTVWNGGDQDFNATVHDLNRLVSQGTSRIYVASPGSNAWNHKTMNVRSGSIVVDDGYLVIDSALTALAVSKNSIVLLPNAETSASYGDSGTTTGYIDVATGAHLYSGYPIYAGSGGSNNTLVKVGGGVWAQVQNVCQSVGYNGGGKTDNGGSDPYCNIEIREGVFRLNMGEDVLEVPADTADRTISIKNGARLEGVGTIAPCFDVTIESGATLLSGMPDDVVWVPTDGSYPWTFPDNIRNYYTTTAGRNDGSVDLNFQGDLTFADGAILEFNLNRQAQRLRTAEDSTVTFNGTLTVRLTNMPMSIAEPVLLTNFAVTPSGLTADGSIICPEAIAIDAEVRLCTAAEATGEGEAEEPDTAVKNLWLIPTGASHRWTDATGSWSEEKWHQGDATVRIPNGNNTDSTSSQPNPSNPKDSPTARVESAAGVNLTIDEPSAPTQPNPDAADALNFWGVYGLILTGDTGGDITLAQGGTIEPSGTTVTGNLYGIDVGTSFWKLGDGTATIDALLRLYGNDSTFTVSGGNLTLHRPILQARDVGLPSIVQLENAFEIGSGATLTLDFALPEATAERNALRAYYQYTLLASAPTEMGSVLPEQAQLLQGPLTGSGTLRVQGEGTSVRLGSINEVGTTADSGVNFSVGTGTTLTLAGALSGGGAAERTATVEAGAIFDLRNETALGSADWTFNLAAGTADDTTGTPAGAIVRTDNNVRLRGTVNVTGTGSATLGSGDLAIDDSLTVDVPAGATLTLAAANVMTPSGASDDAVFTKTGAGVLDVTSGNFELGLPVSIEEGTLRLSARPNPSPSGDRTIDWNVREGGTLAFAGTAGVFNLESYGSLTVEAGGTLALTDRSVTINGTTADPPLLAAGSIVSFGDGTSLPTASSSGVLSFANGGTVDGTVTVALNIDATNPNNLPSQAVTLISFGDGIRQGTGEFILGGDNAAEIAAAGYTLHDNGSTVTLEPFGGDALYTWAANGTEGSEWATGNNWVAQNGTGRVTWPAEFDTPPAVILPEVSPLRDEPTFHIPAAFRTINWTGEAQTLSGLQASNDAANADGTTGGDYTLTGSAALTVDGTLLKTGTGGLTFNRPVTVGSTGALSLFGGTVTFAKGATLTNTAIDLNNATLAFTGDTGTTISGRLAGNGSGTVLKSGANTLTVRSTIGEAVDRFDIDGGTLRLTADYQADALTPTFDMASGTTLTLGGAVVGGAVIEPTFAEGNTGFTLRWEGAAGTATAASPVLGKVPASTFDYQPASGHLILDPESLPEGAALILGDAVNESSALRLGAGEGGEAIRLSALTAPVGTVIGVEPATDLAAGDWATERALTLALNTEDLVTVGATFMGAVLEGNTTVRAGLTVEKAAGATVEPTLAYIGESDHNALGTLTAGANARVEVTGLWAGPARAAVGGTLAGSGTIGADGTTADNVEVVAGGILSATVTSSATGAIEPAELTVQGDLAIQNGAILAVTAAVQGDGTTAVSHVTTDSVNFTGSRVNIEVRLDAPDEAAVNGKPILTWSSLNGTTEVTAVVKVRNENGDWVDSKDYSVMKEGSRLVLRRASGRFWMILR